MSTKISQFSLKKFRDNDKVSLKQSISLKLIISIKKVVRYEENSRNFKTNEKLTMLSISGLKRRISQDYYWHFLYYFSCFSCFLKLLLSSRTFITFKMWRKLVSNVKTIFSRIAINLGIEIKNIMIQLQHKNDSRKNTLNYQKTVTISKSLYLNCKLIMMKHLIMFKNLLKRA